MDMYNNSEAWNFMRVQPVEDSFDFDINNNIYIVRADRRLQHTRFLGLYKDKSVRAVGAVIACITAIKTENDIEYDLEYGKFTDRRVRMIESFLEEHPELENDKHRFFFVDRFYQTDFRKMSAGGLRNSKIFDLLNDLGINDIPDAETLVNSLEHLTW